MTFRQWIEANATNAASANFAVSVQWVYSALTLAIAEDRLPEFSDCHSLQTWVAQRIGVGFEETSKLFWQSYLLAEQKLTDEHRQGEARSRAQATILAAVGAIREIKPMAPGDVPSALRRDEAAIMLADACMALAVDPSVGDTGRASLSNVFRQITLVTDRFVVPQLSARGGTMPDLPEVAPKTTIH